MSPKWLHFGTLSTICDNTNNVTILLVGAETITSYSGWQYQSCFHAPKSQDWLISKALGENTPRSIENRSAQEVTSVSPTSKLKDQLARSSPIFEMICPLVPWPWFYTMIKLYWCPITKSNNSSSHMCQVKSPWLRLTSCMAPFHLLNNFHRKRLWKIGLSNWKAFQGQKWAKPPAEAMKQTQATASWFQSVKEGLRWGTCWRDILTLYMQLLRIRKWFTLHHHHTWNYLKGGTKQWLLGLSPPLPFSHES